LKKNRKKVPIFVTTVHRWGEKSGHSYIAGISYNENRATLYGKAEYYYRGGCGKYEPNTRKLLLPYKTKNLYLITMWNDKEHKEYFSYKIFVSRRKALEVFVELKESSARDNIKLKQISVDRKINDQKTLEWLHCGWNFFNVKEQEILRNLYSDFINKK
jgi:hypothetical protein